MNWSSSQAPISDFKEWKADKKLEIRPDFQRKAVWSRAAQIMLIDSIIKDIPMPKIYLETKMEKGVKYRIVIDGQQRLTAIFDYIEGKFTMPIDYDKKWAGKKFEELKEKEQNKILSYEIDLNCLNNPTEEDVRNLYSRVNKYTVQLNKQELRRADFPGDFIELAEQLSEEEFFVDAHLFTPAMTRRMLDIEYIEELLIIVMDGLDNKKDNVDIFCEKYQKMQDVDEVRDNFMEIISDISIIFSEKKEMLIRKSRFKQRSDFYGLFAAIRQFHSQNKTLDKEKIQDLQNDLHYLDKNIKPLSSIEELREYAIRCTSDANSYSSRKWRVDFLTNYLEKAYK